MKFAVHILLATCLIASIQSFAIKEPIGKLIEAKKSALDSASTVISSLKHSAVVKGKGLVSHAKAVASAKLGLVSNLKNAKLGLIKSASEKTQSTITAAKAATKTFVKTAIGVSKAKFANAASLIAAKTKGLYQHKVALKDSAVNVVSGIINNKLNKKKALISSTKSTTASKFAVGHVNYKDKHVAYKYHTYTSNEAPIVGKVFVQAHSSASAHVVNEKPTYTSTTSTSTFGVPAKTYGPPADTYGPPADTYGPPAYTNL